MTVRRESVVLDLDDRVSPGLLRVAAAAEIADRSLEHLGGQQVSASRTTRELDADTDRLSQRVERGASSIDQYSGRLGLLISGLAAVGPAIVPITAVAIPAVTTLGSNVVALGLGVGVAELAFHGLGDALGKFNKAQAEPTATNIANAQAAMDKLPASSQRLVLELSRLTPLFDKLRDDAASGGLTAGVTDGLHALLEDTPLVRQAIRGISGELGALSRDAGESLASSRWRPFLRFAGDEAPQALHTMASATGDVAHGLAEILMAFDPLDDQVNRGVLGLAQDFDRWATSLDKTKDFQSFLEYVQTNGPQVIELLGDAGQLFVDLVEAAAPLGGPTVQALDLVVKALDAIANSPLGTPILLLLQINAILKLTGRGLAALGMDAAAAKVGLGGVSTEAKAGSTYLRALRADAMSAGTALRTITGNVGRNASTGTPLLTGVNREALANLAKGAALAGGFAFAMSGLDERMGLTNTTSLALAGSIAGPWGAAVGGAIGLTMDLAHASDDLVQSMHQAQAIANGSGTEIDFGAQSAAIGQFAKANAAYQDGIVDAWTPGGSRNPLTLTKQGLTALGDLFTHTSTEAAAANRTLLDQQAQNRTAFGSIFNQLTGADTRSTFGLDLGQLQLAANRAQPAMQALGITVDDLQAAADRGDGSLDGLVSQIVEWINHADSAKGRSEAVANAFAAMGNDALTTEDRVTALKTALDALIDPKLNLGQARDAFHQGLNNLSDDLAKGHHELTGYTDAAIQNRNAIRQQVSNLKDLVERQADAGASAKTMAGTMKTGRKAILDSAEAAGLNRAAVSKMIDQMGLTPKQIRTQISLLGADDATRQARAVKAALDAIERVVNVHVNVTRFTNANLADVDTPRKPHAGGGLITGPGGPTDDQVPVWGSNGEFMMRAAAVDHYGLSTMQRMNALRLADGGPVGTHTNSSPGGLYASAGLGAETDRTTRRLKDMQRALGSSTKLLDQERAQRQQLMQAREQVVTTVRDNFRGQIFGVTLEGGVWAAGASASSDPAQILRQQIRDAREYREDIRKLRKRHLRGGALAEVDTLEEAQQALALPRDELRQITRLFRRRNQEAQRAGQLAGDFRFGHQINGVRDEIRETNRRMGQLNREVKHLRKEAPKNADRAGDRTAKGVSGAIGNGQRRRPKH